MTRRKSERRVIDIPLGKGVAEHVDARNLNQPSMLKAELSSQRPGLDANDEGFLA